MITIGIVGTRRRDTPKDLALCVQIFEKYYEIGDELVSGGCKQGADRFAEIIAKSSEIPIKIYYAEWKRLGMGAGFTRNAYIARDADILIAMVAGDRTGGTENTIATAMKLDKRIVLINEDQTIEEINFGQPPDVLKEFYNE